MSSQTLLSDPDYDYLRMKEPRHPEWSIVPVRVVDLFSGCGGLSLGVREACNEMGVRFEAVMAVDNSQVAMQVYRNNFECTHAMVQPIETLVDGELGRKMTPEERRVRSLVGSIDVVLAGPPCQGASDLNNYTRRNDPRNDLYDRATRFIEVVRPVNAIVENVPGITHASNRVVERSVAVLQKAGYNVDSGLVDLADLGVPQHRKRHVVLASLKKKVSLQSTISKHSSARVRSAWWAINDLQDETAASILTTSSKQTKANMKRIAFLHEKDRYNLPNYLRPPCHRRKHSYLSAYGRMNKEDPAQTITGGFGSPGQGRFVHPTRLRTLTPHEAARIQFFPDFFDFSSAPNRVALQRVIGNAAPMKLSYVLSSALL